MPAKYENTQTPAVRCAQHFNVSHYSHRASDVEPRELVNVGAVEVEGLKQPVVRFSSCLELERADRVVDVLQAAHRQHQIRLGTLKRRDNCTPISWDNLLEISVGRRFGALKGLRNYQPLRDLRRKN